MNWLKNVFGCKYKFNKDGCKYRPFHQLEKAETDTIRQHFLTINNFSDNLLWADILQFLSL